MARRAASLGLWHLGIVGWHVPLRSHKSHPQKAAWQLALLLIQQLHVWCAVHAPAAPVLTICFCACAHPPCASRKVVVQYREDCRQLDSDPRLASSSGAKEQQEAMQVGMCVV